MATNQGMQLTAQVHPPTQSPRSEAEDQVGAEVLTHTEAPSDPSVLLLLLCIPSRRAQLGADPACAMTDGGRKGSHRP